MPPLIGYHGQFAPLLLTTVGRTLPDAQILPFEQIRSDGLMPEMHALVTRSGLQVDADFLAQAQALEVVIKAGSGTDNIDHVATQERGIVIKVTGGSERSVAELAIALMFSVARHVPVHCSALKDGRWDSKRQNVGRNLADQTLGVIGFGRIGRETATLARCLGMSVQVFDRSLHKPEKQVALTKAQVRTTQDVRDLVTTSDIVSLHLPWQRGTAPILCAADIDAMRNGSVLINTSRAQLVERAPLAAALSSGRIAAGLDVHYDESGQGDLALFALPNVVALPHVGAQTTETHTNIARLAAQLVIDHFVTEEALG